MTGARLRKRKEKKQEKEKEKTTPFGVNLMRSQVLYRAAQDARLRWKHSRNMTVSSIACRRQ